MNNNYQQDFTKLKIANYNRKSTEDEDKQVLSIGSQIEECSLIAKSFKLPKFIEIFEESKSAKTEFKRPEFTRMIKQVDSGKVDSIVCWKLDRLARNMTEGGIIMDYLSSGKIKAIFTYERLWLPSDNVILMAVHFSQGTQFSKDLSVNVKRGQRTKAKNGTPAGLASLGFLNSKQGEKGTRWWYEDKDRFWKMKKVFELFLTGNYSVRKLHEYARDELKLTTPSRKKLGGKPVTFMNTYKNLKNPIYAGFFFVQGQRYQLDNNLPRMITEEQFDRIQQMISSNRKPRSQKHKSLYAGFIFGEDNKILSQDVKYQIICDCKHKYANRNRSECPKCGKKTLLLENPKYFVQSYYYNNRKKKAGIEYNSITVDKVTEEISKFVEENLKLPISILDWSKKYIHELKDKEVSEKLNFVYDKEKRMSEFENKKSRLREMFRNPDFKMTQEEYKSDLAKLETEYKDLQQEVKSIDWVKELNEIVDLTSTALDVIANGSFDAKRNLLTQLGANLTWNDKKLFISNKKTIETFILGINEAKPIILEFGNEKALVEQGLSDENSTLCIALRRR